jgi:hypothetical protein
VTRLGALLRGHQPLVAVLAIGTAARVLVAIAYRPALFFPDSWSYLTLAYSGERFAPDRPSGYPILLELIGVPGHSLTAITTLQHLAGLAVAILVYALLIRAGAARAVATVAAALVVLNAYAIVLEQTILAESFFTLALVASFYLVTGERRSNLDLAAAGVLLAGAVTMRSAAGFAVPLWLLYVFYRSRWRALVALAAVLLPLLAYATVHDAKTGKFGLTTADGWFLYGRVGEIADCDVVDPPPDTRDLCEPISNAGGRGPLYYIWDPDSAANRRFPEHFASARSSAVLRRFAVSVIEARPAAYAGLVVHDTLRWFEPGAASAGRSDTAIRLPEEPRLRRPWVEPAVRDRFLPGFEPQVHAPSAVARAYAAVVRVPRPLLGLMVLLPLALLPLARRAPPHGRPVHLPEALLLSLSALAMLVGPAATSGFIVRYMVPTVPLIVCAGGLAASDLLARARARRPRRAAVAAPA